MEITTGSRVAEVETQTALGRSDHTAVVNGNTLYVWGGCQVSRADSVMLQLILHAASIDTLDFPPTPLFFTPHTVVVHNLNAQNAFQLVLSASLPHLDGVIDFI